MEDFFLERHFTLDLLCLVLEVEFDFDLDFDFDFFDSALPPPDCEKGVEESSRKESE